MSIKWMEVWNLLYNTYQLYYIVMMCGHAFISRDSFGNIMRHLRIILSVGLFVKDMMTSSNGHFPHYWLFVRGIHRSLVNSSHQGQWRGAVMFSLICACVNSRVNNRKAGDLRRHQTHYDIIVMNSNQVIVAWLWHVQQTYWCGCLVFLCVRMTIRGAVLSSYLHCCVTMVLCIQINSHNTIHDFR